MREYKRKTQRGSTPKDVMELAVKEVLIDKGPAAQLRTNTTYPMSLCEDTA